MTEYSGTGDPMRGLALLWREAAPHSRRRRSDLSVDRIVKAAVDLADAEGLEALSMRHLASELRVGTMSLYTYLPGRAELIDAMLDLVYAETNGAEVILGDWRASLDRIARENWALYLRHPWMLDIATIRTVLGPNAVAKYDRELQAVTAIGLSDVEMDAVITLVLGHVEGAARGATQAAQIARKTGLSDEQWWRARAPLLARLVDPQRYPTAVRVGAAAGAAHGAAYSAESAFEFGLERILDGIAVLVRARHVSSASNG